MNTSKIYKAMFIIFWCSSLGTTQQIVHHPSYDLKISLPAKVYPVKKEQEASLRVFARNNGLTKFEHQAIQLNGVNNPHWKNNWGFTALVVLLTSIIVALFFKRREQSLLHEKKIKYHIKDLELRSLRSQMNPHFIYNVLNSIQLFIYKNDTEEAGIYLKKFANLMRSFLEQSKLEFISLEEEAIFLVQYLNLEKLRLRDRLSFSIRIDASLNPEKIQIPTLLLQPLIENAIKHGVTRAIDGGYVKIEVLPLPYAEYVLVEIENSGPSFDLEDREKPSDKHQVHGINLIGERLNLLKNHFGFSLTSMAVISPLDEEKNQGCQIALILPLKKQL